MTFLLCFQGMRGCGFRFYGLGFMIYDSWFMFLDLWFMVYGSWFHMAQQRHRRPPLPSAYFFFFSTLVTGPRRSLGLKLGGKRVCEPEIRARLESTARFSIMSIRVFLSNPSILARHPIPHQVKSEKFRRNVSRLNVIRAPRIHFGAQQLKAFGVFLGRESNLQVVVTSNEFPTYDMA